MDDRNATVTKGDIADSEVRLRAAIAESRDRLKSGIADSEGRLMERLREFETQLLNAFYSYTHDKRVLESEGNESALRSRIATIETRLTDVEQRLNIPPQ